MRYYRIVSDYGYGDKSWHYERMIPEDEVLAKLKELHGRDCETIEQAEGDGYDIHYIEEDCESDEEDWDWMDS
jgi:hypothetical protein